MANMFNRRESRDEAISRLRAEYTKEELLRQGLEIGAPVKSRMNKTKLAGAIYDSKRNVASWLWSAISPHWMKVLSIPAALLTIYVFFVPKMWTADVATLQAGDSETPSAACDRDPGETLLIAGELGFAPTLGQTSQIVTDAGAEILSIVQQDGGILVNGNIYDQEGHIITTIENNQLVYNRSSIHRLIITRSSIEVHDNFGNLALGFYYLNWSTIKIVGEFYTPRGISITIPDEGAVLVGLVNGPVVNFGGCYEGAGIHLDESGLSIGRSVVN